MSTTTPAELSNAYYRHVPPEALEGRSPADLEAAVAAHLELAQERPQGRTRVRIRGAGGRSVVEIVAQDMPYLVDSVTAELGRRAATRPAYDVHLIIHPVFDVVRDLTGQLESVSSVADGARPAEPPAVRESWMRIETDPVADDLVETVEADLHRVLGDVRDAVEDTDKLQARVHDVAEELRATPPAGIDAAESEEAAALLAWLADDHFTFLGYREYELVTEGGKDALRGIPGTGLGLLRTDQAGAKQLTGLVGEKARERTVLVLAKANSRSTVGQPAYLDYIGVKTFDDRGEVTGERLFLGLFSTRAATESVTRIPVLRHKAAAVLGRSGFDPSSHAGKALMDTLEGYPREELFQAPVEDLGAMAAAAMAARERRTLRVFVRPDTYGRYVSVLVTLPRDRYSTAVRERFSQILTDRLGGTDVEFSVRISDATSAQVQFVIHVPTVDGLDVKDLERRLGEASRSWRDDLAGALVGRYGEAGAARYARLRDALPEAYKENFPASVGAVDLGRLAELGAEGLDLALYEEEGAPPEEARLKVYRVGAPLSLSRVLPMLTSLGVEVTDERPYELAGLDVPTYVYDFGLRYDGPLPSDRSKEDLHEALSQAVLALWEGRAEIDGFNRLVLAAGIDHRETSVLRAYAKYLRQAGTPFGQATIEAALGSHPDIARALVELFEERFDPARNAVEDPTHAEEIADGILAALDEVASLDEDRILRTYLTHIRATLRTNFYREDRDYLSLKLDPQQLPDLPQPRPAYEIFVYAPTVEGVHLRFGKVARGGLRWSDRRDDFRTEILGLVKAQMVKNTVIVPVGAKGGFVPKGVEGSTAYRTFIQGLLDVTDNLVDDQTVPPPDVVRYDDDDSYLVVAADKGTATFSDLANSIAHDYGFWLGDAFASGGSVGYDHKAMGITAKGAWVSVRRHFREMGIDCQREDFTCVGVGDMSGDVFGNGMLLSEHLRLVAAFDHRDIFLDPTPDAATSYAERRRLFELPRSSWQDYDRSLISAGGGVYSRSLKSIPIGPEVRAALGLEDGVDRLTPAELMSAILRAPVDLFWNGGIGTYVKAAHEPHAAAGDKANDAIRIDGAQLRARCVGEGGNLGFTQAGRVEYARHGADGQGGRINTDAIDNSAGVDTSDHEVNLKILLDKLVAAEELTEQERNELLGEMTDDVERLVLRDNSEQNLALANAAANAASLLAVHEDQMASLESRGVLSREVEGLPTTEEVRRRLEAREGLTAPEHAVLMSWTKIELARELLASDLPEDSYLDVDLAAYFPDAVRDRFRDAIEAHPLRREIIVTQVVNDLVNGAGTSFWHRLAVETGASPAELTRANFVAREIFGSLPLRKEIATLDFRVDAATQTRMRLEMRTLVERASRWLITNRLPDADGSTATVERYGKPVQQVMAQLPDLMSGQEAHDFEARRARWIDAGVPEDLATRVAVLGPAYMLLGVVRVALDLGRDPVEVARAHFGVGERLGLPRTLARIVALPRDDAWQTMARAAIREDLHGVHAALTARSLTDPSWLDSEEVERVAEVLARVSADESADLARLSVGLRSLRTLLD